MITAMNYSIGKDVSKLIDYTLVMHYTDGRVKHMTASADD